MKRRIKRLAAEAGAYSPDCVCCGAPATSPSDGALLVLVMFGCGSTYAEMLRELCAVHRGIVDRHVTLQLADEAKEPT